MRVSLISLAFQVYPCFTACLPVYTSVNLLLHCMSACLHTRVNCMSACLHTRPSLTRYFLRRTGRPEDPERQLYKFWERFHLEMSNEEAYAHMQSLIIQCQTAFVPQMVRERPFCVPAFLSTLSPSLSIAYERCPGWRVCRWNGRTNSSKTGRHRQKMSRGCSNM